MPVEKTCQFCGKRYFVKPCHANSTKFCSQKCSSTANGKIMRERRDSKEYLLSQIKVDKKTGCWIWQGYKNKDGYGTKSYKGKMQRAHRVFYEVFIGKIPKGMCALHRCDVAACVRPSHLFIGTYKDNNEDMYKKKRNRQPAGEKSGMSKLTEKDVLGIRRLRKEGLSYKKIIEKFPISLGYVSHIVKRKTWPHI